MKTPSIRVQGLRPGLQVRGLDRGMTPVADWLCSCGHHERATGRPDVQQLAARVEVGTCPHLAAGSRAA
ncbi:hypothetical protein V2W30_22520 [Streptomyces sp. Q6]|uniref:Uncharacterized protein n=1 Tax=Streptomyces citrinus TaxID=3118173 RepID=A0ACD5AFE3_9ACTN